MRTLLPGHFSSCPAPPPGSRCNARRGSNCSGCKSWPLRAARSPRDGRPETRTLTCRRRSWLWVSSRPAPGWFQWNLAPPDPVEHRDLCGRFRITERLYGGWSDMKHDTKKKRNDLTGQCIGGRWIALHFILHSRDSNAVLDAGFQACVHRFFYINITY